jgi:hypothetical protein
LELSKLFDPPIDSSPYYQTLKDKTPIKFSSMLYKSVCVNIYDSQSNNKKIYFFSPIALLNNLDVASIHNLTVPQVSVGFSIWNQEVRKEVTEHLNQLLSKKIEPSHVKVLPFNSVRLTSKVQSADFSMTNEWLPYGNQQLLRFTLICPTREDCNRVKSEMEINPKQFEHLQLDFKPQLKDGMVGLRCFLVFNFLF